MRPLLALVLLGTSLLGTSSMAFAQAGAPARPASAPPPPVQTNPSASHVGTNPASAPMQTNPASAPLQPASDAGATERGLNNAAPPATGVSPQVRHAANHDTDANGHTLDPHGKPVGQKPAVPSTVK
jgi:hypothetical protein